MAEIKQFNETGTVFGSISKSDFENINIVIPKDSYVQMFQESARYYDDKIIYSSYQIHNLTKLRDMLLPKLMNNEIKL